MAEHVSIEVDSGVATVRFDRPPMNALSFHLQDELRDAALEVANRDDVEAVVLYGGPKIFAAGADVKEMAPLSHAEMVARSVGLQASFTALARIPQPVVAAVAGYALGGGCELALTADFRVCGDNATFGQPEILLGIIPGAGGTQRLPRLIGPSAAKDLILTGRLVDATEALALGLVDRVVPPDDVYPEAHRLAARFVGGPRLALRAAKAAIDRGLETDLDTGLELERAHFAGLFASEDRARGMASFIDQGPGHAEFVGR